MISLRFFGLTSLLSTLVIAVDTSVLSQTAAFHEWVEFHGKNYDDASEHTARMQTWMSNDARIRAHNTQIPAPTYTLGHNAYSDLTEDQFSEHFKLGQTSASSAFGSSAATEQARRSLREASLQLPDYVNWVLQGAVTPVKNQGSCGSCWAFSTTGSLEGAKFLKSGELVSLSEQNLLDCDHEDMACSGGLMDNAFKFDEKSGGLCSEEDYPYKAAKNPSCNSTCADVPGSIVTSFVDVPPGSEKDLLAAIAMQPVSIAIEASTFAFQFYKNGVIMDDKCGSHGEIDHGVLAVGYGSDLETGHPYFLVKNSWGETWGDAGYVKIGRQGKNEFGICSILKMASYPIVD